MNPILKFILLFVTLSLSNFSQAASNILVFGDSLSAGYGIAREASWAHLLQQELKDTPYTVINASISGETTSGGLRRIDKALIQHQPAIVIVELGANDGLRGTPLAETEKNLNTIIKRAKQAKARVLLLGIQLPPNYGPAYTERFRAMYPKLAKRHGLALLPFMLEGIPPDQFLPDNLHPNAAAQARILQNVMHHLKPLLH
ncbi:MAG: arylesterase [Gammaproteobacteria bacterium]|nr:arylesterase [Gammaproteobacteria bacterium]MBU1448195.1 arylesterase [Gammaproteobacteria bacterium]MDD2929253.1 arylesterase [Sideroxydans sp.]MDD5471391.1 arylesterase [Sideroxydans sp.]